MKIGRRAVAYKRRLQDIGDYLQPRSGLRLQEDFDGDTFMMTPAVGARRLCRDRSEHAMLYRRRLTFFSLVAVSILLLVGWLTVILLPGGLTWLELVMIALFAANLPWLVIGLCNAVIGFALLRASRLGPVGALPIPRSAGQRPPSFGRIALVMPVHDEQSELVFRSLQATVASLDATGCSDPFDIFLLSDTRDQQLAAGELQRFRAWQRRDRCRERLHYRRRRGNRGFKAGNIRDFCTRWGHAYTTCMIVLDADSMMTGAAILRLVALMQANPRLGIVQTLVVGLPATSPFARIFQFGMRHGMRAYTMGSAWWQGDAGPYWGHNAIVRLAPFIAHCRLPRVPGRPPLGGPVLSHDQVEAVLMRRAGWEVRLLPIEGGSFEANPPTLLDFVKRDLRWCHGNMQYTRLLSLAGVPRLGRMQMLLAIFMYTAAPCWLAFCLLSLLRLLLPSLDLPTGVLVAEPASLRESPALAMAGLLLLFVVLAMSWAPKLFGLLHALTDAAERTRYGGGARLLLGAAIEVLFSALLTPVVGVAQTIFMARLLAGSRQTWQAQWRSDSQVSFGEAARELWPQALLGVAFASLLAALAPGALAWSAPMLVGLLLAIPFAVLTSSRRFGCWLMDNGLCATPEELCPEPEVHAVCPWIGQAPSGARARSAAAAAVADTGS